MNVNLTPELEHLVHSKVKTGRYNSANEVVREALRLMDDRDQLTQLHKDAIRKKIAAGVASLRAGRCIDGDAFMTEMMNEIEEDIRIEKQRIETANAGQ